ncbi:MAG: hemolysin family protein [Anaerolineae bacterium]
MTPTLLAWIAVAVGLVLTVMESASEGALSAVGVLTNGRGQPSPDGRDAARSWVTVWILGVLGPLVYGIGSAYLAVEASRNWGTTTAVFAFAVALLVLLAARLLPVAWAVPHAETVLRYVGRPLDMAARLFWPVRAPFRALRRLGAERMGLSFQGTRDDAFRALAHVEEENGGIEEDELEMITGIMELGETKVREVMVPRMDIVAIPSAASLDDALDTIIAAGHSRIPVYTDTIDTIEGLLYAKDLLKAFRARNFEPDMVQLLRDAYFVPESKPVDELLEELQTRKVHMAVVVDEYGGTAGIVTIEDLLEEIVGEIQDEYDHEEPRIERVSDDEIVFTAGMDIDDVNRLMDISLPTDEVDTLGGLVFTGLGKVPELGESAVFDDAEIEVLELDGRRINRVRVLRREPDREEEPSDDGEALSSGRTA